MAEPKDERPPARLSNDIEQFLREMGARLSVSAETDETERRENLAQIANMLWTVTARRQLIDALFSRAFTPRQSVPYLLAHTLEPTAVPEAGVESKWNVCDRDLGYGLAGALALTIHQQDEEGWDATERAVPWATMQSGSEQSCWCLQRPFDPSAPWIRLKLAEESGYLYVVELATITPSIPEER